MAEIRFRIAVTVLIVPQNGLFRPTLLDVRGVTVYSGPLVDTYTDAVNIAYERAASDDFDVVGE
jgi:hypothetical protein